jgi:hypothetical protein
MTAKLTPSQAAQTKGDTAAQASQQGYALPEGFTEVGADRFMYNPNKGCTGSLQGYLLGKLEMPPIQRGKEPPAPWECLLVRTTKPCQGIDRDQKVVDVPVGSDVLTPATFKLDDAFSRAAADPAFCWEVFIAPKKKTEIGHGQTMWLYALGANKNTKKARNDFGVAALLPGADAAGVKALPQGAATAEGAGAGSDNIPF